MGNISNSVLSPREETYMRFDFDKATVEVTHLYGYTNDQWRYTALAKSDEDLSKQLDEWAGSASRENCTPSKPADGYSGCNGAQ